MSIIDSPSCRITHDDVSTDTIYISIIRKSSRLWGKRQKSPREYPGLHGMSCVWSMMWQVTGDRCRCKELIRLLISVTCHLSPEPISSLATCHYFRHSPPPCHSFALRRRSPIQQQCDPDRISAIGQYCLSASMTSHRSKYPISARTITVPVPTKNAAGTSTCQSRGFTANIIRKPAPTRTTVQGKSR